MTWVGCEMNYFACLMLKIQLIAMGLLKRGENALHQFVGLYDYNVIQLTIEVDSASPSNTGSQLSVNYCHVKHPDL